MEDILKQVTVDVCKEPFVRADGDPKATKANVEEARGVAGWADMACHGDKDKDSVVLAKASAVQSAVQDPDGGAVNINKIALLVVRRQAHVERYGGESAWELAYTQMINKAISDAGADLLST